MNAAKTTNILEACATRLSRPDGGKSTEDGRRYLFTSVGIEFVPSYKVLLIKMKAKDKVTMQRIVIGLIITTSEIFVIGDGENHVVGCRNS